MAAGELAVGPGSLTLDQFVALGEEIAALARAGVPIEAGLAQLGREMPQDLRRRFAGIAESLARGDSLDQAVADPRVGFSPIAQGVIAAGVRANRLAPALEGLVRSARLRSDLRRLTGLALVYPLGLILIAYAVLWFNLVHIAPEIGAAYVEIHSSPPAWYRSLEWFRTVPTWLWLLPPAALLVVVGLSWLQTGKAAAVEGKWTRQILTLVPGVGRLLRDSEVASFAELAALLLENGVPLDAAVQSAAGASGDHRLIAAAKDLSDNLRRGEALSAAADNSGFPPLLLWMMAVGQARGQLNQALFQAAAHYAEVARRRAEWIELMLPVGAVFLVGGSAVVVSVLLLFGPWLTLLGRMANTVYP